MRYAYRLFFNNGESGITIQNHYFTEEQILSAFKDEGVVKVQFHRHIPNGYHLCGCGALVKGTKDELCDECREIYGHTCESEL